MTQNLDGKIEPREKIEQGMENASGRIKEWNASFKNRIRDARFDTDRLNQTDVNYLARWAGLTIPAVLTVNRGEILSQIKKMHSGTDISAELRKVGVEGCYGTGRTLNLDKIADYKINKNFEYSNIKQQAGKIGEVVGAGKENIQAIAEGKKRLTVLVDDLPKDVRDRYGFVKNDPYVDRVVFEAGKIIERTQVKLVGKTPKECLDKLLSKKYSKYFTDGKVDKVEIPKDYYPKVKRQLAKRIADLEQNNPIAKKARIEYLKRVDAMLKPSTVTSREVTFARKYPRVYKELAFLKKPVGDGIAAAGITATIKTFENLLKVNAGQMSFKEAVKDITHESLKNLVLERGTSALTDRVIRAMKASPNKAVEKLSGTNVPALVVADIVDLTVTSTALVYEYKKGNLDGKSLAKELGGNAVEKVAGAGGAWVGFHFGGPSGAVAGRMAMAYTARKCYDIAVDQGKREEAIEFAKAAKAAASDVLNMAEKNGFSNISDIKTAMKTQVLRNIV